MTDQLTMENRQGGGQVECLGLSFPNDIARREHFLVLLAEKLKDPAFRNQEGFPQGSDEAILNLSDPPYYTACPNPWLNDFVHQYGRPYDSEEKYSREPFTADVSEGKNDKIYNAHGYHTKVPHKAIMRYILHYTQPNDVILDAFCGTGMTGVAAQLCGDRSEVQSLGYVVDGDGTIKQARSGSSQSGWESFSKLGARQAVLSDLSPAATFIANNYNAPRNALSLRKIAADSINKLQSNFGWMFQTLHKPSRERIVSALSCIDSKDSPDLSEFGSVGAINYTVWSDVFACPECAGEIIFWDSAVDVENGMVRDVFPCPHCGAEQTKRRLERVMTSIQDPALGTTIKQAKVVPVRINYTFGGKRYDKIPDQADLALADKIERSPVNGRFPHQRLMPGQETRRNDPIGITHVHHFYTRRNLSVFSFAFNELPYELKWAVTGSIQRGSKQHQIAITRVGGAKAGDGGATAGHRRGTLYVPSNQIEMNPIVLIRDRLSAFEKAVLGNYTLRPYISTQSTTSLGLPDDCIDYLFFDPPFGANITYSELNSLMEGWLNVITERNHEAIEDRHQKKDVNAYRELMARCFREAHRVLKPGRWMTVEFSNTQASIWNAIQTALQEAGFVVANVSVLDKKRGGLNAIVGVTAVKQDLVISAYKPNGGLEERFAQNATNSDSVWDFVRTHLSYLPCCIEKDNNVAFISERDPRIIFDRTVAWFVQHGLPVPMSSQEFLSDLWHRFVERDGMVFLPEQTSLYDKMREKSSVTPQRELFVYDERSAIDWAADYLRKRPSTYQELQPEFFGQLGAGWKKHESRPELMSLLEDNFLRYDGISDVPSQIHSYLSSNFKDLRGLGKDDPSLKAKAKDRWYAPDPSKAKDLEQKRERSLLKEFENYKSAPGRKLKEFRLEALRAGFKAAWGAKDYKTIIGIAQKIPEEALQEDEKLLLWYDQALTRMEADA